MLAATRAVASAGTVPSAGATGLAGGDDAALQPVVDAVLARVQVRLDQRDAALEERIERVIRTRMQDEVERRVRRPYGEVF